MSTYRAECGTNRAYQQHVLNDEPVDEDCRRAARSYHADYRAQHPEKVKQHRGTSRARYAALVRLAEKHRGEYLELLAAERAARGLPPPRGVPS